MDLVGCGDLILDYTFLGEWVKLFLDISLAPAIRSTPSEICDPSETGLDIVPVRITDVTVRVGGCEEVHFGKQEEEDS